MGSFGDVVICRLANPDQDFQWAVAEMALLDFGDRASLLNILRFVNDNFKLEPGLFVLRCLVPAFDGVG
jgi:hypothetical protein